MRIMVDTNILVSSMINDHSQASRALAKAMNEHTLVICTYILDELQNVFKRKFPNKSACLDVFLSNLAFELCYTPKINPDTPKMRDENDRPILQVAIDADIDAILTGDNDFHALNIERPVIISPADVLTGIN